MNELWYARTNWFDIGLAIGVKLIDLEAIKKEYHNDSDKCLKELIHQWLKRRIPKPTWAALVCALRSPIVGRGHLSDEVMTKYLPTYTSHHSESLDNANSALSHSHLQPEFQCPCRKCNLMDYLKNGCPTSSSSSYPYLNLEALTQDERDDVIQKLSEGTSDIVKRFSDLFWNTIKSWERRQVKVSEVVNVARSLSIPISDEERRDATSINDIFSVIGNCMSFFNHESFGEFIQKLGDEEEKKSYDEYCRHFNEFCLRRIFEVSPTVYSNQHERMNREFLVLTSECCMKVLADVKNAQNKIATLLHLRASQVHIERVDNGCIILVLSIEMALGRELFPLKPAMYEELKSCGYTIIVPPTPAYVAYEETHCQVPVDQKVSFTVKKMFYDN